LRAIWTLSQKRRFNKRVAQCTLSVLIKHRIYLRSKNYTINYDKMQSVFYSLYKTDRCEEFLQHHPFSLQSLLQFISKLRPSNNANTTTPRYGTVAVSQAQVSESFVTEEHVLSWS